MKKLLSAVLCAVLLLTLCVAVSAEDVLYHFECEDGEITGAAKEYKDGNIQDVTIASGGKIVGLGGTNDAPQMASTVTFPEINLEKTGVYKIAFRYQRRRHQEGGHPRGRRTLRGRDQHGRAAGAVR